MSGQLQHTAEQYYFDTSSSLAAFLPLSMSSSIFSFSSFPSSLFVAFFVEVMENILRRGR